MHRVRDVSHGRDNFYVWQPELCHHEPLREGGADPDMLRPRHPRPTGSSRFGALLDEDQLTGLEPARNRETLRLVLAAALTAAAAVGIGFLNSAASLTGLPVPRVRALLRRL